MSVSSGKPTMSFADHAEEYLEDGLCTICRKLLSHDRFKCSSVAWYKTLR
jgi:hypothetical protein